jgi:protein TonB
MRIADDRTAREPRRRYRSAMAALVTVVAVSALIFAVFRGDHPSQGLRLASQQSNPPSSIGPGPSADQESGAPAPDAPRLSPVLPSQSATRQRPNRSGPTRSSKRIQARKTKQDASLSVNSPLAPKLESPRKSREQSPSPSVSPAAPAPSAAQPGSLSGAGTDVNSQPTIAATEEPIAPQPGSAEPGHLRPASAPTRAAVVTPPVPVSLEPPRHPGALRVVVEIPGLSAEARLEPASARVRLRLHVQADGAVGRVSIAVPSGHPDIDGAAALAARSWRFLPARRDGTPIASVVLIWVAFLPEP